MTMWYAERVKGRESVPNYWEFRLAEADSGPYLALVGAAVKLARRDLKNPNLAVEARAFLRGESFATREPGIDLDLFAELLGYGGRWDV